MAIKYVDEEPRSIREFEGEPGDTSDLALSASDVQHVAEIFNTPLKGAYNWDYRVADDRIKKLYELGKQLNWNASVDVSWDKTLDWKDAPPWSQERIDKWITENPWDGYGPWDAMTTESKCDYFRHYNAWSLSNFLHGEQGALLVASQLASCAPSFNAKLYAASQTFDEARHVEVFNRYLQTKLGMSYPINRGLKLLLDKILTDERWDLKFIGMQIILEGLALAAFHQARHDTDDPVLDELLYYVIRDEARHVTFGVNYLEEFVQTLSQEEREDRAQFAYEACIVSRDRLIAVDVFKHFGWNVDETRERIHEMGIRNDFLNLLYARVIPNLKRIGLLTDRIRPKFEEMGVLNFENLPTDGDTEWSELVKPLEVTEAA